MDNRDWLLNRIDKLEEKLDSTKDSLEERLTSIEQVLIRQVQITEAQERNLELHMKRSDALEDQNKMLKEYIDRETISIVNSIRPIETHVTMVERVAKYIIVPLIVAFILGSIKLALG